MKKQLLIIAFVLVTSVGYAQEASIELLRSDVKTKKVAIMTEVMQFTNEEANAFWPVYGECEVEFAKIGDRGLDEPSLRGWVAVSMEKEWKRIFGFEAKKDRPQQNQMFWLV